MPITARSEIPGPKAKIGTASIVRTTEPTRASSEALGHPSKRRVTYSEKFRCQQKVSRKITFFETFIAEQHSGGKPWVSAPNCELTGGPVSKIVSYWYSYRNLNTSNLGFSNYRGIRGLFSFAGFGKLDEGTLRVFGGKWSVPGHGPGKNWLNSVIEL